jgi:hypothetical protein
MIDSKQQILGMSSSKPGIAGKAMRIIERLNFQSTAQTIGSCVAFAVLLASTQTAPGSAASETRETPDIRSPKPSFPRLMGMNIGAKGKQDPAISDDSPASSIVLPARDGIILCRQLGQHNYGE